MEREYKTIVDNKLREFSFKVMLVQFKVEKNGTCFHCMNPDSLEHTFLDCASSIRFYQRMRKWSDAPTSAK